MTGEKVLIFGMFFAFWTISTCQSVAQDPESGITDFSRHDILANQNRISHGDNVIEETPLVRTFTAKNKTCPSCVIDRELYIKYTKEAIKKDILKKLGMKKAPNVSKDMAPKHLIYQMMEKYASHSYEHEGMLNDAAARINEVEDDENHFQTRILNILGQDGVGTVPADITNDGHEIQYFNLNVAQLRDLRWPNVVTAKMFLHLPAAPTPKDLKVWIDIRQVVMTSDVPTFKKKRIVAATLLPDKAGWVEIQLKDITQEWFKDPSKNMGLEIKVSTENGVNIPVGIQHQANIERNIPYLQLEIRDSWNLRKRRTLSRVCSKNKEEGGDHCCMESLKVDFNEDYHWSFVIYPASFEPNYCSGDCSLGKMMPENAYAHILQQSGISPCCNPQKMGTLELLYMDENNNVVQGTLPKMMVQRCGCA